MGFTSLNQKFPLFTKHYLHTDGKDHEFTVIGHYVSDLGRDCVIGILENPLPSIDVDSGEALVIDALYISGPVV